VKKFIENCWFTLNFWKNLHYEPISLKVPCKIFSNLSVGMLLPSYPENNSVILDKWIQTSGVSRGWTAFSPGWKTWCIRRKSTILCPKFLARSTVMRFKRDVNKNSEQQSIRASDVQWINSFSQARSQARSPNCTGPDPGNLQILEMLKIESHPKTVILDTNSLNRNCTAIVDRFRMMASQQLSPTAQFCFDLLKNWTSFIHFTFKNNVEFTQKKNSGKFQSDSLYTKALCFYIYMTKNVRGVRLKIQFKENQVGQCFNVSQFRKTSNGLIY
jgi:hypothetical protein